MIPTYDVLKKYIKDHDGKPTINDAAEYFNTKPKVMAEIFKDLGYPCLGARDIDNYVTKHGKEIKLDEMARFFEMKIELLVYLLTEFIKINPSPLTFYSSSILSILLIKHQQLGTNNNAASTGIEWMRQLDEAVGRCTFLKSLSK